jgi:Zn-dependent protease with chaperone function
LSFDPSLPDDRVNVSNSHPLREALVLVSGVIGVVAVLALGIGLAVDVLVPMLPVGLESRLLWPSSFASQDDDESDPRQASVAALLERLAGHWQENPYSLRVAIWEEDQPNALAFPGGLVVVTTGLLDRAGSENELAFVLGHELGHFHNRDHLRGLGRGIAFALIAGAIGGSGAGDAAKLAALSQRLAARGFDRDQERDADRFGLEIVAAEYGHVAGALAFFEQLEGRDEEDVAWLAAYLSTHPVQDERIETLRDFAEERGFSQDGALRPLGG